MLGQNLLILADLRGHFDHFGVKKVDFSTFSKLCWTCLGWELFGLCFRPQRAYFWVYFQLKRSINDSENQTFQSNFEPFLTDFRDHL